MPHLDFTCVICEQHFTKYVPPSDPRGGTRLYCSRSCQGKGMQVARGNKIREIVSLKCAQCEVEFERKEKAKDGEILFCTKKCQGTYLAHQKLNAAGGYEGLRQLWTEKHGEKKAKQMLTHFRQLKSERFSGENNPMHGKVQTIKTRQKISEACSGIPNKLKGVTFEEFYGKSKARALRLDHSKKLREGYKTGRLSPPQCKHGNYVTGCYKGLPYRSSYEYSFMRMLERKGYKLADDVLYEPQTFHVPYKDVNGVDRTYIPDFYVKPENTIYEIKAKNFINTPENVCKINTARDHFFRHGIRYVVLVEDDLVLEIPTRVPSASLSTGVRS